jgi:hypothetical protein
MICLLDNNKVALKQQQMRNYTRSILYIIKEMLPSLLTGIFIFISILLMFQVLKLTEFVLAHGVTLEVIARLVISFLEFFTSYFANECAFFSFNDLWAAEYRF